MKYFFLFCVFFTHSFASNIFVIGDSHCIAFSGIPNVYTLHIGPVTMHRVGRDQLNIINLKILGLKENDIAVFAFGEIDVRCHIGKQRELNSRNLDEIIQTLTFKYVQTIQKNRALFNNLTCVIYSIPPPINIAYNPHYPFYGSLEDRVIITEKVNDLLQQTCSGTSIKFLNVYKDFADDHGVLRKEISDGNVHILSAYNEPIKRKLNILLSSGPN